MVMNIVASLPNGMGQGVYYWEPLCVPDEHSGWSESMGILAEDGKVMETIKSFSFTRESMCLKRVAKLYHPKDIVCVRANRAKLLTMLPQQIQVLYYDGSVYMADVLWDSLPEDMEIEDIELTGKLVDKENMEEHQTKIHIYIVDFIEKKPNLVINPQWNDKFSGWNISKSNGVVTVKRSENELMVESLTNFRFTISQTIQLDTVGVYRLCVSFRGVDTTGVDVRMFMETSKQYQDMVIHPTDEEWTVHELENIRCDAGMLTFGIKIIAPPIHARMSEFYLEKMD